MKTVAITAASWLATLTTFIDGDVFRETNIDILAGDIADRIGFLKEDKASLGDDNTWTGANTFSGSLATHNVSTTGTIYATAEIFSQSFVASLTYLGAPMGLVEVPVTLANSDQTLSSGLAFRVPVLTGNRTYTLWIPAFAGLKLTFTKPVSSAFTATIKDAGGATIAVLDASAQASVTLRSSGGGWVAESWSPNVSSILATV